MKGFCNQRVCKEPVDVVIYRGCPEAVESPLGLPVIQAPGTICMAQTYKSCIACYNFTNLETEAKPEGSISPLFFRLLEALAEQRSSIREAITLTGKKKDGR